MRARLVLVLLAHHLHRRLLHNRERQQQIHRLPPLVALLIQPYVLFYFVFLFLLGESCMQMWDLMQASSWLSVENFPRWPFARRNEGALPLLRCLAIASPIFATATGGVTLLGLWRHHVNYERHFDKGLHWCPSHSHDLAMQVAAMPLIYGVFSLDCVVQTLRMMTGAAWDEPLSPKQLELQRHITEEHYATNLELAELCEAWALYNFGRLCLMRIRRQIREEVPLLRASLAKLDAEEQQNLLVFADPEHFLFRPLEVTTGIGVKIFVYTCAVKSLFALTVTFFADTFHVKLCEKVPTVCNLLPHMDGAAFVTSTIAILSLLAIEHGFHQILQLKQFTPVLKFLGVKVLVTVTFMQSLVISLAEKQGYLKADEASLCNACLLCFEVLPLAALTFVAWAPRRGDWYDADAIRTSSVGRLAGEGDWAASYTVLGAARGSCRGTVEASKLEALRRENGALTDLRGASLEDLRRGRAERQQSPQRSRSSSDGFGRDAGLLRWNSFCDLKRIW